MPDPAPPADLSGRTVGDFLLVRRLGAGGMGQVYLARQLSLKREVAVKLLKADLARNETALKRFQAEAEAVARLSHPNIVQVYAVGEHDGLPFMALEYVRGRNLREYLALKGPPDLPIAVSVIRQVAQALQRASELGIVHRDIKPENILVNRTAVKVADFGLSRLTAADAPAAANLTQSGMTLGTPLYMAPEQVRGLPTDHRTDLYALGVTCYHLLAGEPPFAGTTPMDVAMKHVHEPPPPLAAARPDLPADLCGLVHKLMAKKPEDRYQTAKDVLRDLVRIREGLAINVSVPLPAMTGESPAAATIAFAPRSPARWGRLVGGGVGLFAVFAGGWLAFARTNRPAEVSPPAAAGLPDARLPDAVRLLSGRERELAAKLNTRGLATPDAVPAGIELGLLQLRERRFADAEQTFRQLEQERADGPPRPRAVVPKHLLAAKFGVGVVLAARDKADDAAKAFDAGVRLLVGANGRPIPQLVKDYEQFLLAHPEFTRAASDALQRIADTLKLSKLADPRLDDLRIGRVVRGPG